MQVHSRPTSSRTATKTTKKASSTKSTSSVKSQPKVCKSTSRRDTFTASKDGGKPNAVVPNFGAWALAAPPAPQPAAKPAPSEPAPRVAPQPVAPEAPRPTAVQSTGTAPASPKADPSGAKAFDDLSWSTAQARHTADFANQAGNVLKSQTLSNVSGAALKPLNPAAGVLGGAAFAKQAYDSYQKGNYADAAFQGVNSGTLLGTGAGLIKGGELLGRVAGRAAPAVGGALQAYEGIKTGDTWDTVSGGAKIAGAAMVATGFGAPIGASLIIGSYMADLGRWGYNKLAQ